MERILVINPGSTSTKISVFEDRENILTESVHHDAPELGAFKTVNDQVPMRKQVTLDILKRHGLDITDITVIAARGGNQYPVEAGVYKVDDRLYADTRDEKGGSDHPAKLGTMIAYEFTKEYGIPAYMVDPTNVDEMKDVARITGIKGVYRNSQLHALNHRAVAFTYAKEVGKSYEDLRLVVAHIDGGITIAAHENGKIADVNVGSGGDGAFAPSRIGSTPVLQIINLIENGTSIDELKRLCSRQGGLASHFGTNDADKILAMIDSGDKYAKLVWDAMIYQTAKYIGEMAVSLKGNVDAILLTGGLVRFPQIVDTIKDMCGFIAPIKAYPGEFEQEALAHSILRVIEGKQEAKTYTGKPVWTEWDFVK
ncbi:MAG: butyrate kinase [Eubacteriales bacterium]|nr:butyrate kinase [Eubacteriales bacterium]